MKKYRNPSLKEAWIVLGALPVFFLTGYVVLGLKVEIILILSAVFAAFMAFRLGYDWSDLEKAIAGKIGHATPTLLIFFTVGMVVSTFMFSGSIPMLLYYSMKLINPQMLYLCAFILCAIMSMLTGTSWGAVGTVGVAMFGVATGLGLRLDITVGAIISGAVFGDKLSPLSETTNLAPLCAGTTVYKHIYAMLYTTIPSAIAAMIVYFIVGKTTPVEGAGLPPAAIEIMDNLSRMFKFNIILVIPFLIIVICAFMKKPALPAMLGASFSAMILGVVYQGFSLKNSSLCAVSGFNVEMTGVEATELVAKLLNRGGMSTMWSITLMLFCGYSYAAILMRAKFLETALAPIILKLKSIPALIGLTCLVELLCFLCAGTSYVGTIMVGDMFKKAYIDRGVSLSVLSRCMEDVGTMVSPLIPWGAAGIFYFTTLGVPVWGTGSYGIWAVNTYTNPFFAMLCAFTGIGILKMTKEEQELELAKYKEETSAN